MKLLLAAFALTIIFTIPAAAQSESEGNREFWVAELGGAGHYMVRHRNVVSISRHEYIADGAARVFEVTIATNTSVAARFYYMEPVGKSGTLKTPGVIANRVQDTVGKIGGKVGVNTDTAVTKNYPSTTHAHTVDFRLPSLDALNSLYSSVFGVVQTGKGKVWKM